MAISFEAIGQMVATFQNNNIAGEGVVCKVSAADTVSACSDGDVFCGVSTTLRGNYVGVALKGFAELHYTGDTAPTLGYCNLAANGAGGVKVSASGRAYLVVHVNTTEQTVGLFLA